MKIKKTSLKGSRQKGAPTVLIKRHKLKERARKNRQSIRKESHGVLKKGRAEKPSQVVRVGKEGSGLGL